MIAEACSGVPFTKAPSERAAEKSSSRSGSKTAPATVAPWDRSATETQKNGRPCAKFVVPSRGSTYQACPALAPGDVPSSPMMA